MMMGAPHKPGADAHGKDIETLKEHELCASNPLYDPNEDLIGIALSGGGIRSATFSLGVLQGLARHRWLSCFDYLSTVSGGGYIGSFWSTWRARPTLGETAEETLAGACKDGPVRHIREFSNYLSPRQGLLSYDTGRLVLAPVVATLPSLVIVLSLIVLLLQTWSLISWLIVGGGYASGMVVPGFLTGGSMLVAITALVMIVTEIVWWRHEKGADTFTRYGYAPAAIVATLLTAFVWSYASPEIAPPFRLDGLPLYRNHSFADVALLMTPAIAWTIVLLIYVAVRAIASPWTSTAARVQIRSAADRVAARLILLIGLCVAPALLWSAAIYFYNPARISTGMDATGLGALIVSLSGLFVWARKLIGRDPNKMLGPAIVSRLRPQLPKLLAAAVVLLLFMSMSIMLAVWQDRQMLIAAVAGATVITGLALLTFQPNRIGLHSFYRSRLSRAYLGASNPKTQKKTATEEGRGDDVVLTDLATHKPLHLICCAANDLTPTEPLSTLGRGAVSAVLSPIGFSVDHKWKKWDREEEPVKVGAAITASGAAFNSLMGSYSKQLGLPVVFLMAALNLRLGMWLQHPHAKTKRSKEWTLPGVLFFKELFGVSNASRGDVHLSDGGHFENMGVYELLRRRCKYIVAVDCGADGDFEFNDLANLVRKAREDFICDIDIDVSPLRKGENGFSKTSFVRGIIRYDDGATGTLLLFKPTLMGNEPVDILNYRTRNANFPAETTGDQFYDEAQWESYRRLGLHAVETAFGKPSPAQFGNREALRDALEDGYRFRKQRRSNPMTTA